MHTRFLERFPILIPSLVAAGFLLAAAFGHWPYGFYQFMRLVILGGAVWSAIGFLNHKSQLTQPGVIVFALVAILFNPIAPIHLKRDHWFILDLICAAIFIVGGLLVCPSRDKIQ